MRAPSFHDRRERDLKIEMTPMIDVVFLLLVFFVWTASFRMIEVHNRNHYRTLREKLPQAVSQSMPCSSTRSRMSSATATAGWVSFSWAT